jgi:hypothetical protein
MTIKIYSDRIDIGDFTLFEGNGGVQFGGVARAENFKDIGFQGSVAGFQMNRAVSGVGFSNIIERFPFTSDTNAIDYGDDVVTRRGAAGQSSTSHGYGSGGITAAPARINTITKFLFATINTSNDVGDLTQARENPAGHSSSVSGYSAGGYLSPAPLNIIDKFPFATDTNATDVGDTIAVVHSGAGQSSSNFGYRTGGSPGFVNTIEKFPFAADTNATDVGDLTQGRIYAAGQSSTTHGYTSGGYPAALPGVNNTNTIDKFPFSTDTNASDVGDLTVSRYSASGQSSTTHGYSSGGYVFNPPPPSPIHYNTIDKFPFAADTNATDVGDMPAGGGSASGHQV